MAASAQAIAEAEAPQAGASVIAYDGSYDWKRHDWSQPLSAPMPVPQTKAEWALALSMPMWRVASGVLYKIVVKGDDQGPDDVGQLEPFLPNVNQLKFLLNLHYRNIVLKARQLGFCVMGHTLILTADMKWVRADEIQPGTEIISVDEFPPGGKGQHRRMRTGRVEAVAGMKAQAFRITFDDGRTLECTDKHPWLSRKANTQTEWRSLSGKGNEVTGKLTVGCQVRWITNGTWEEPSYEDGWMGGMLDGEGSISKSNVAAGINVSQREGAVWDRLVSYAKDRGYHARVENEARPERPGKHGITPVPKLCFGRMDEMLRLIGTTRPTRFIGNRFWEGRELPGKRNGGVGWATIVSIEPLGEQVVYDIQTSTKTYIANGFVSHNTTLASIMALDRAMFTPNQRCGIIADEMDNAASILTDKVLVAYENLPAPLLAKMPLKTKNATQIRFKHNNSSIRVAISMRGGTIHFLHISELGKIASKYPAKAKEIRAGSLPAVPKSGICTIESTAEGADGLFFEMSSRAEAQHIAAAPLTQGDYNFHFFPWYLEPGYRSNPKRVKISPKQHEYFDSIEAKADIALDMSQRAWYVTKLEADFGGDTHLMQQEMPSTPEEAWSRSTQGTYLTPQLTAARAAGRIGKVPHIATLPVHTAWDIGAGDGTGIWMFQQVGTAIHVIRYIENWSKGYAHYVRQLRETGWIFGQMLLPHDAASERQVLDRVAAPLDMLMELAKDWDWRIVPRVHDFQAGIDLLRAKFPEFWFDEEGCKEGLNHLALYRKKFNSRLKSFQDEPEKHDGHSEAPDALRQIAQGFDPSHVTGEKKKTRRRATGLTA